MELVVKDNVADVIRSLDTIQRRQIPYAMSRALNDTAVDAQGAVVSQAQRVFENRKRWWIKGNRRTGIRVGFSNKTNLVASVYTNAYFAKQQEHGNVKTPRGSKIAVPTDKAPKRLFRSDGVSKAKTNSKVFSDRRGVFQRMSRGKLKMLFSWTPSAVVTPRFSFGATAKLRAQQRIKRHFQRRLAQALRSAR